MGNQGDRTDGPLRPGDVVLERYRVEQRLEAGGTSIVYRAFDDRLSRPVCLKVFHHLTNRAGIYRATYEHFVQEAFALSKLTHPNTLRIYDFGHLSGDDGPPVQVSEFMGGGTLVDLIRGSGPMSPEQAGDTVRALAGALSEAHEVGIIHRDIKPRNILYASAASANVPKLADFGIAKSLEIEHTRLANRAGDTQVVAGGKVLLFSAHWAAPEQLLADPVDAPTDTYSLAVLTAYMLTAKCPFRHQTAREAYLERGDGPALMSKLLADTALAASAKELLAQCVQVDPSERPQSIDEFGQQFQQQARARLSIARAEEQPTNTVSAEGTEPSAEMAPPPQPRTPQAPVLLAPTDKNAVEGRSPKFLDGNSPADIDVSGSARVRVTMLHQGQSGATVHVRGLNCFVKKNGGRPATGTQFTESGRIDLVTSDRKPLARCEVVYPDNDRGHSVFRVGDGQIAVGNKERIPIVALDFGPGRDLLFFSGIALPGMVTSTAAARSKSS